MSSVTRMTSSKYMQITRLTLPNYPMDRPHLSVPRLNGTATIPRIYAVFTITARYPIVLIFIVDREIRFYDNSYDDFSTSKSKVSWMKTRTNERTNDSKSNLNNTCYYNKLIFKSKFIVHKNIYIFLVSFVWSILKVVQVYFV